MALIMSTLERATHICLIAVSVVALGLLLEGRLGTRRPGGARTAATQLVGKHLAVARLDWKSSAVNVVFFISTHCHFCEESMPFYRQVTEIPGRAPQKLAISAISRDDPELLKGTLSKQHVNLDGVYRAPVIDALSSTPIVLIVDANGIVRRVFEGRLDSSREKDVLKIVASGILGTIRT
jgi:hypothetical protein